MSPVSHFHGTPSPLGLSKTKRGWNLAVYSSRATQVSVGIFHPDNPAPHAIFPMTRSADIWHIEMANIPENDLYAYRVEGIRDEAIGDLFNSSIWLADPFAKILDTPHLWNHPASFPPVRAPFYIPKPFDWQGTKPPSLSKQDLVIYEMHVRGFTADPASGSKQCGTYRGIIEKIPYLKKLGVNAIELMPMFEFDENRAHKGHLNYWGYNSISFFAPKRNFSSNHKTDGAIQEFKELVRELHRNGIEIILDVVYNHTAEGKEFEPTLCWRGIDNRTYYFVDRHGRYQNYSGCFNTFNANHPAVRYQILESMRYWVEEMRVDGFRFDLASILTRGPDSHPMENPPLIESISHDPVLSRVKLIAEAWDAAGLYQVGTFPKWGPWSEWNGHYRDIIRKFIKGTAGKAGAFASALCGSEPIYGHSKTPLSSVNFITAHDGYTMRDLVSYEQKHNWENGEQNRDGNDTNDSWNCGVEGETANPEIISLRERQMRNFFLALFLSQGIPMLLMGDEYGHTRKGNNNPYVQDNELNWFLWSEQEKSSIFPFVADLISFRKNHPELRRERFLTDQDIRWHGEKPGHADWSDHSKLVAFNTHSLYVAFNSNNHSVSLELPFSDYHLIVDSKDGWDRQYFKTNGPKIGPSIELIPYSAIIAKRN